MGGERGRVGEKRVYSYDGKRKEGENKKILLEETRYEDE